MGAGCPGCLYRGCVPPRSPACRWAAPGVVGCPPVVRGTGERGYLCGCAVLSGCVLCRGVYLCRVFLTGFAACPFSAGSFRAGWGVCPLFPGSSARAGAVRLCCCLRGRARRRCRSSGGGRGPALVLRPVLSGFFPFLGAGSVSGRPLCGRPERGCRSPIASLTFPMGR